MKQRANLAKQGFRINKIDHEKGVDSAKQTNNKKPDRKYWLFLYNDQRL